MTWEEYRAKLIPIYDEKNLAYIEKAFRFASEAHKNDKRLTDEPYMNHCVDVSLMAAELKLSPQTVAAALLHDVLEMNPALSKNIRKEFDQEMLTLVKNLSKVNKIKYLGVEKTVEAMRKMFIALSEDIAVVIIKLLSRLDNLKTLELLPEEKVKRIALETLEVYAPVADRLGMGEIKAKLEDAAFKYAYPEEYDRITKEVAEKLPERKAYLQKIIPLVEEEIKKEGIEINSINSRAKHYYSLWKKLLRNDMNWDSIYDLIAVRVLVNSVTDCYAVLGIIHKLWRPLSGRIKDYLALPKQNGYKSLHTTVFCVDGKITEFQIRTREIHEEAEYGITAHWAWDMMGKPKEAKQMAHLKFGWINQLQEWQKNFNRNVSSEEFLESLKIDFFKDRIFVLTPKGDVIDLPEKSTPVDFAYHIHSDIGDSMVAAKVNNRIVPLSHQLNSGDIVEITTQKNKKPNLKWLEHAKTSIARHNIKTRSKKIKQ